MTSGIATRKVIKERVLIGEDDDPARRGTKRLVARSECRFACADDATIDRCVEQLRRSDEHLRSRPEEMVLWDWQTTYVERPEPGASARGGGEVVLGVAWYDLEFFLEKKDTYTDSSHLAKYVDIGLNPGSVRVTHWRLEGAGAV